MTAQSQKLGPVNLLVFASLRKWLAGVVPRNKFAKAALVACLSALAVRIGIKLLAPAIFSDAHGETVYWPVDGILTAVLLMVPRSYWPAILFGSLVSQAMAMSAEPWPIILADGVGNLVEPLIAAYSLPRFKNLAQWMEQPRLSSRFIVGALTLAPGVASSIYGAVYAVFYHESFLRYASKWVRADLLGMALALPLVLVVCSRETYKLFLPRMLGRSVLVFSTTCVLSWSVFRWCSYPIAFITLPLLLLIVFELGFSGAVIAVNIVTFIAASATLRGYGPFSVVTSGADPYRIPILQLFLTIAMLSSFPVGIALTQRKRFEAELKDALHNMENLASHDALTGVHNRRHFDLVLEEEGRRCMRDRQPLALLMIDVDHFKAYNDSSGHVAGDNCLRRVAGAIRSVPSRSGDLIARYGGEEFAVLLPNCSLEAAITVGTRICRAVALMELQHAMSPHRCVTVSVGCYAQTPAPGWMPTLLINGADQALYAAKDNGRNCVEWQPPHYHRERDSSLLPEKPQGAALHLHEA